MEVGGGGVTQISQQGIEFITQYENFEPHGYEDVSGNCTIGYGELLHLGPCTQSERERTVTRQESLAFVRVTAQGFVNSIASALSRSLLQYQLDALASFSYTLGTGWLTEDVPLRQYIETGDSSAVAERIKLYNKSRKWETGELNYVQGLQNRRCEEADLFTKDDYFVSFAYCPRAD